MKIHIRSWTIYPRNTCGVMQLSGVTLGWEGIPDVTCSTTSRSRIEDPN